MSETTTPQVDISSEREWELRNELGALLKASVHASGTQGAGRPAL